MAHLVEEVRELADVGAPLVERLDVRLARAQVHDARRAVDLRVGDHARDDQVAQERLHFLKSFEVTEVTAGRGTYVDGVLEDLGHAVEGDLRVVLRHHPHVLKWQQG